MALTDNKLRQKYGCALTHPFPVAVKGGEHIFKGALIGVLSTGASAGLMIAAIEDADFVCLGVADYEVDAQLVADGALYGHVVPGRWGGISSATAGDAITLAQMGQVVYAKDDNTVAKTDGGATRGAAGKLVGFDDRGKLILSLGGDLG